MLITSFYRNAVADEGTDYYEQHIRPVLVEHCYECHSADAEELQAGLRLDQPAGWLDGGDSGPAIIPEAPEESLLLTALSYEADFYQMPPDQKLADEIVERFTAWIEMGAPAPQPNASTGRGTNDAPESPQQFTAESHWAFQRPHYQSLDVAKIKTSSTNIHSILDAIIQSQLAEVDLAPSPQADAATLVRRLSIDLTGLPASFEEISSYQQNGRPDRYQQLVERLIHSPRFGERWARHWLDVARFADTKGYVFTEDRNYPDAYKFRDWVIESFNRDRPIDDFLRLQLAADQLSADKPENLSAMGFLTLGRRFLNDKHDIIDDRIDVVTRGMMGLTVTCARCHDHKYDPIPTADYYSLYGVFSNSEEPGGEPSPLRLVDRESLSDAYIFVRGNSSNRGKRVERQFLKILSKPERPPFQKGSGRLELAHAIADHQNPLTARVFINRVWGHLTGSHLVDSPSDFGTRSRKPDQLALLDYLTIEFVKRDWSIKWLVREIVLSATYRQSATDRPTAAELDPENRLYWKMNRRRLDFESMRDGILLKCGQLDQAAIGGPSENLTGKERSHRRSLYAFIDRQNLPSLFRVFDVALPDTHVPRRYQTTVPQQALFLMNSPFIRANADSAISSWRLAEETNDSEIVRGLYRQILGREPNSTELDLACHFLAEKSDEKQLRQQAMARFAQVLLLSNEFLFLD